MTRKHFEAAAWLARWYAKEGHDMTTTIEFLIEWFSSENPRFDVERFRKACSYVK